MGQKVIRSGFFRAGLTVVGMSACVAGCAAVPKYMGVDIGPTASNASLASLARRAAEGNTLAQFELGMAFEQGNQVPRDLTRAISLYKLAARTVPDKLWVYRDGGSSPGQLSAISGYDAQPPNYQAKLRLEYIKKYGSPFK